jgi:thiol-disulfide isomerase/thioredoxin
MIEQQPVPPQPPQRKSVWTTPRVLLVALVLVALAVIFSSQFEHTDRPINANVATLNTNARVNSSPAANTGEPVPLPDDIKATELKALDGTQFKLADYAGKVVVLNLWATWCRPCRDEIPQIVKLNEDYQGRDVEVVGLTMEDDEGNTPEAVKKFVSDFGIKYRVAWAGRDLYARFLAPGYEIPQTYIIDRQGRIRKKVVGGGSHVGNFIRATLDDILADKQG